LAAEDLLFQSKSFLFGLGLHFFFQPFSKLLLLLLLRLPLPLLLSFGFRFRFALFSASSSRASLSFLALALIFLQLFSLFFFSLFQKLLLLLLLRLPLLLSFGFLAVAFPPELSPALLLPPSAASLAFRCASEQPALLLFFGVLPAFSDRFPALFFFCFGTRFGRCFSS